MLKATWQRLWRRITDSPVTCDLASYGKRVAGVAALEPGLQALTDGELREAAHRCLTDLRVRFGLVRGAASDARAAPAASCELLATVREAGRRLLGVRLFDEQVIAGMALAEGQVVEMQTGEGKTLAAVAPAVLLAAAGRGVHVWTFNDYLAGRDAEWMGPLYALFGLRVSAIAHDLAPAVRREAYRADVTYSTAKEVGFDFLRDQLVMDRDERVLRPLFGVIVDEADSLLIDDARIPLVLAGGGEVVAVELELDRLLPLVRELQPGVDFEKDENERNIYLTDAGIARMEQQLGCSCLHDPEHVPWLTAINLSLHALFLLQRDVDYIVRRRSIELVDDKTGRAVKQRRWPCGLQAALELKEGLVRQVEGRVLATSTLQHLCRLYDHRAGMTGTAQACAEELRACYGMRTLVIPPHTPCTRLDQPDLVFADRESKQRALLAEIRWAHSAGQPVLIGTASVAESEHLASLLDAVGLGYELLNAKNDSREAALVAEAGAPGTITLSTNMAGRGTDIRLGGVEQRDHDQVAAAGGLYVIGTNRHESRRVDDQLRGRAGRQGDPGRSRFFISLEDPFFQRYDLSSRLSHTRRRPSAECLVDDAATHREIERTQRIVEGQNHDIRMTLLKYSELVEQQRQHHQAIREELLSPGGVIEWLEQRDPALLSRLRVVREAVALDLTLRRIVLSRLDETWAEHLAQVADIKEGIYLYSAGGSTALSFKVTPIDAFRSMLVQTYAEMLDQGEALALRSLRLAADRPDDDLEAMGIKRPGATWTYLVSDDPFADLAQNIVSRLKRRLSSPRRRDATA